MPFVKSSTVLPGTFETEQETNEVMANPEHQEDNSDNQCKKEIRVQQGKHILFYRFFHNFLSEPEPVSEDVGQLTTELVEKMEHFNVGQEKISTLKTVAIKLEVV